MGQRFLAQCWWWGGEGVPPRHFDNKVSRGTNTFQCFLEFKNELPNPLKWEVFYIAPNIWPLGLDRGSRPKICDNQESRSMSRNHGRLPEISHWLRIDILLGDSGTQRTEGKLSPIVNIPFVLFLQTKASWTSISRMEMLEMMLRILVIASWMFLFVNHALFVHPSLAMEVKA